MMDRWTEAHFRTKTGSKGYLIRKDGGSETGYQHISNSARRGEGIDALAHDSTCQYAKRLYCNRV